MTVLRTPVAERFWQHVTAGQFDACWPWTGALRKGYGTFKLLPGQLEAEKRKDVYAHRVAYRLVWGVWPADWGLHGCDNPVCCNAVNTDHVHDGTPADNVHECQERGRYWQPSGSDNHNSSLTLQNGWFGVSQGSVSRIVRGVRYVAAGR